jgi:hypothetical protein
MQPGYTSDIHAIAVALGHSTPWWQPWILAPVAAVLGVIGGFVGQIILLKYNVSTKLGNMRRMAYSDITELFAAIDMLLTFPGNDSPEHGEVMRRTHFKTLAPRMSEDYIKANLEVYARLPERPAWESILGLYHHLMTEPEEFDGYLRSTMQMISRHFKMERLTIKGVRKCVGKEEAKTMIPMLAKYEPTGVFE